MFWHFALFRVNKLLNFLVSSLTLVEMMIFFAIFCRDSLWHDLAKETRAAFG